MKEFFKGKFVTSIVVIATVILAGVAIFTALRLYQLRQESVSPGSPESAPLAWDCSKYTFTVSGNGAVSVQNLSSRDETAQQARVYIDGNLAATLDVPFLAKGQSANIGTVQVPSGGFSWKVDGTKDCSSSGQAGPISCQLLTFTITQNSPTITVTPSPEPTLPPGESPTPTEPPVGGISPTLTPTTTSTATPKPSTTSVPTPTPTPPPPPEMPSPPNCPAEKPDAPTLTSVVRSGSEATLTWTAVNLATHYVISYGTTPSNLLYGVPNTGNVTTYTIASLDANAKYYFTVYAVNDCMPSDGSVIQTSVAGTSAQTGEIAKGGGELPSAGMTLPTLLGVIGGFALIFFALILAF